MASDSLPTTKEPLGPPGQGRAQASRTTTSQWKQSLWRRTLPHLQPYPDGNQLPKYDHETNLQHICYSHLQDKECDLLDRMQEVPKAVRWRDTKPPPHLPQRTSQQHHIQADRETSSWPFQQPRPFPGRSQDCSPWSLWQKPEKKTGKLLDKTAQISTLTRSTHDVITPSSPPTLWYQRRLYQKLGRLPPAASVLSYRRDACRWQEDVLSMFLWLHKACMHAHTSYTLDEDRKVKTSCIPCRMIPALITSWSFRLLQPDLDTTTLVVYCSESVAVERPHLPAHKWQVQVCACVFVHACVCTYMSIHIHKFIIFNHSGSPHNACISLV